MSKLPAIFIHWAPLLRAGEINYSVLERVICRYSKVRQAISDSHNSYLRPMGVTPTLRGCIMKSSSGGSLVPRTSFQLFLQLHLVRALFHLRPHFYPCYVRSSLTPTTSLHPPNIRTLASLEEKGAGRIYHSRPHQSPASGALSAREAQTGEIWPWRDT